MGKIAPARWIDHREAGSSPRIEVWSIGRPVGATEASKHLLRSVDFPDRKYGRCKLTKVTPSCVARV